jgi:hypothetical protein
MGQSAYAPMALGVSARSPVMPWLPQDDPVVKHGEAPALWRQVRPQCDAKEPGAVLSARATALELIKGQPRFCDNPQGLDQDWSTI